MHGAISILQSTLGLKEKNQTRFGCISQMPTIEAIARCAFEIESFTAWPNDQTTSRAMKGHPCDECVLPWTQCEGLAHDVSRSSFNDLVENRRLYFLSLFCIPCHAVRPRYISCRITFVWMSLENCSEVVTRTLQIFNDKRNREFGCFAFWISFEKQNIHDCFERAVRASQKKEITFHVKFNKNRLAAQLGKKFECGKRKVQRRESRKVRTSGVKFAGSPIRWKDRKMNISGKSAAPQNLAEHVSCESLGNVGTFFRESREEGCVERSFIAHVEQKRNSWELETPQRSRSSTTSTSSKEMCCRRDGSKERRFGSKFYLGFSKSHEKLPQRFM